MNKVRNLETGEQAHNSIRSGVISERVSAVLHLVSAIAVLMFVVYEVFGATVHSQTLHWQVPPALLQIGTMILGMLSMAAISGFKQRVEEKRLGLELENERLSEEYRKSLPEENVKAAEAEIEALRAAVESAKQALGFRDYSSRMQTETESRSSGVGGSPLSGTKGEVVAQGSGNYPYDALDSNEGAVEEQQDRLPFG